MLVSSSNTSFIYFTWRQLWYLPMHGWLAFFRRSVRVRQLKTRSMRSSKSCMKDFTVSALCLFSLLGYPNCLGVNFLRKWTGHLFQENGYALVKFFFLMTIAAAWYQRLFQGPGCCWTRQSLSYVNIRRRLSLASLIHFLKALYGMVIWSSKTARRTIWALLFHDFADQLYFHNILEAGFAFLLLSFLLLGTSWIGR